MDSLEILTYIMLAIPTIPCLIFLIGLPFQLFADHNRKKRLARQAERRAYWDAIDEMDEYNEIHYGSK